MSSIGSSSGTNTARNLRTMALPAPQVTGTEVSVDHFKTYSRVKNFFYKVKGYNVRQVESLVDTAQQLDTIRQEKAELIPGEILYRRGSYDRKTKFYAHYDEKILSIRDGQQLSLGCIEKESYSKIKDQNFILIHIGMIAISVQSLTRKDLGCQCMVALVDHSILDLDKAIIAQMELDLSSNHGLVYIMPDLTLTVDNFYKNLSLEVLVKGYNTTEDRDNLILTKHLITRVSTHTFLAANFHTMDIVKYFKSKGVEAIDARKFETPRGELWNIQPRKATRGVPAKAVTAVEPDGSMSVRFSHYAPRHSMVSTDHEDEEDEIASNLVS